VCAFVLYNFVWDTGTALGSSSDDDVTRRSFSVRPITQNPAYWEGVYRTLGPDDVHEWGNLSLKDVLEYEYRLLCASEGTLLWPPTSTTGATLATMTTFGETLGVNTALNHPKDDGDDEPILVLGCGNSKLGEDLLDAGWRGPVVQVDVASRVVESMSHRCSRHAQTGDMQFVQDDATVLSAFDDGTVSAVLDKGLVDALFCADDYDQCDLVLRSVHRVLRPGCVFAFFSFSQPEFWAENVFAPSLHDTKERRVRWVDVQVRDLGAILLYRFQKDGGSFTGGGDNVRVRGYGRGQRRQRRRK